MPTVRIWPGGSSGGFAGPGRKPDDGGAARGAVTGWTDGAARRSTAWLWSVNSDALDRSDGWALTLTMGGTPETSDDWHAARKALMKRLERLDVELQHWVVEWTAKGRPHLHMAVYGPGRLDAFVLASWLDICDGYGWPVNSKAQHIVPISGIVGWLKYVSKHAARGVEHYQRQGVPEGWVKTGRLWGHWGAWPVIDAIEQELDRAQFHRYRRLVTAWQRARMARESKAVIPTACKKHNVKKCVPCSDRHRRRSRRRVGHRFGDPERGAYMGVSGWIPDSVSETLLVMAFEVREEPRYHEWE